MLKRMAWYSVMIPFAFWSEVVVGLLNRAHLETQAEAASRMQVMVLDHTVGEAA